MVHRLWITADEAERVGFAPHECVLGSLTWYGPRVGRAAWSSWKTVRRKGLTHALPISWLAERRYGFPKKPTVTPLRWIKPKPRKKT